jgi:hypothetical protein
MLISHKHKFILLHAAKCAGSSIRHRLSDIIDGNQVEIPGKHPTLSELQEIITMSNHDPKKYMVVSMVRNPFDRMVSWYYHALYKSKSFTGSFEDFCEKRLRRTSENLIPPYKKCDHIIRYEHLQEDFDFFLKLIGLSPCKLPHHNKNADRPKDHYITLHTKKTKEIISHYFASVIEMFDYKFEE